MWENLSFTSHLQKLEATSVSWSNEIDFTYFGASLMLGISITCTPKHAIQFFLRQEWGFCVVILCEFNTVK